MPETSTNQPLLTDRFQQAFTLANQVHATQLRKDTAVPYLAHLMSVAALALEHGATEDAAIAALLHDAVEDSDDGTAMTQQIRSQFGDHVADIVLGCSDAIAEPGQPKQPWRERKTAYIEHLSQEEDLDTLLVSACDKLHNARTIVADLHTVGPAVWNRFGQKDPTAHLWYYQTLANSYTNRVPTPLADELNRVIDQMQGLIGTAATS